MSELLGLGKGGRTQQIHFLSWRICFVAQLEVLSWATALRALWFLQNDSVVAGGGAIEMELSKYLRDYSRTIPGKQQLLIGAYAKALEIIPRQLCDNAGFDATNILNKLRAQHAQVACYLLSLGSRDWVGEA